MTADELIKENSPVKLKEWRETMIEFAQYHVDCALEAACDDVYLKYDHEDYNESDKIAKDSILYAYSSENIK